MRERMILKNPKDQAAEDRYLLIGVCVEAACANMKEQGYAHILNDPRFEMWSIVNAAIRKYEEQVT